MPSRLEDESGTICVRDRSVCYQWGDGLGWELPVSSILIIGEMTIESWGDDYFLYFIDQSSGWHEASFYARGREDVMHELEAQLNCPLGLTLYWCTYFNSNVLWPPHLAGRPLFTLEPIPPKTLLDRLFRRDMCEQRLAKDVEEFIQSRSSGAAEAEEPAAN